MEDEEDRPNQADGSPESKDCPPRTANDSPRRNGRPNRADGSPGRDDRPNRANGSPGSDDRPHVLEQSFPGFLEILDSDPERAWQEFHDFTWKLLVAYPPPVFRNLPEDIRDDITANIVLKCCDNDFRRLRKYQDRGIPFAAWVARIAKNRAIDIMRSRRLPPPDPAVAPITHPDEEVFAGELLAAAHQCTLQLRDLCRVLLKYAARGWPPRDIASLLKMPEMDGKRISDSLRTCRGQLRKLLVERGFDFPSPSPKSGRSHAHA